MTTLILAWRSLASRRTTALLSIIAIAVSISLFVGVERIRIGAKSSFTSTISGTDLIVGARAGNVQLLLYSVFRIGNPTSNISMNSLEAVKAHADVAWVVPISLGDSHRGYRVMGTTNDYFKYYRYRNKQPLKFKQGRAFDDLFDVVVGAEIVEKLGYKIGTQIVVSHGIGAIDGAAHDNMPFRVSGILQRTGTPVDRTVHISLEALEAIHIGWDSNNPIPITEVSADLARTLDLKPDSVTAALVGTKSRFGIFKTQRFINQFKPEPLTAVLPGVALQELWTIIGVVETALSAVSAMVVLTALLGMVTMTLSTLNERRQELAILRSVGAHKTTIFLLLISEAALLSVSGILLGVGLLYGLLFFIHPWIEQSYGLYLMISRPSLYELKSLCAIFLTACAVGVIPAFRAYRHSLADGMSVQR